MDSVIDSLLLGARGAEVSRIGFGCDPLGGHQWGQVEEGEAADAVLSALDLGINFFDTADTYGLGRSEEILGQVLRHRRDEAVIASKFGVRWSDEGTRYDNRPEWLRTCLEGSLTRLRTDRIDLYQVHYPDPDIPLAETLGVLGELRDEGKILSFGVTNTDLSKEGIVDPVEGLVSFSGEYSIAKREAEPQILSVASDLDLTFLSWGSLGQGMLTGKYHRGNLPGPEDRRSREVYSNFHGKGLERCLAINTVMRSIVEERAGQKLKVASVALRWVLDRIPGSVALVGIKRTEQLEDAAEALGWTLSPSELARLEEVASA